MDNEFESGDEVPASEDFGIAPGLVERFVLHYCLDYTLAYKKNSFRYRVW